jgi:hypothetical protein
MTFGRRARLALLCFPALAACGTTHMVRPVGEARHELVVAAGGPLMGTAIATNVPAIDLVLTHRYGWTDRVDTWTTLHTAPLLLETGWVEVGASLWAMKQNDAIPSLSVAASVGVIGNASSAWALLDVPIALSWYVDGPREHLVYFGGHHFALLPATSASLPLSWQFFIGWQGRVDPHVALAIELGYRDPFRSYDGALLQYLAPGGYGVPSLSVGVSFVP